MLAYEQAAWDAGYHYVAGVDEAGRGPLAGPVVAACVYIPADVLTIDSSALTALNDSKQCSAVKRSELFRALMQTAGTCFGIGIAPPSEIDRINILQATIQAMNRAADAVKSADFLLVDGRPVSPLPCSSQAIVKGDTRSMLIAAASILAKVTRDRMMVELDRHYPGYGLAAHKGYGTAAHLQALRDRGPTPIHRKSFAPVRELLQGDLF